MTTDTKGVLDDATADAPMSGGATVLAGAGGTPITGGFGEVSSQVAAAEVLAGSETIPVLRETVHVSKREVETGRVTIHKTVTERDEAVEMMLRRTDVSVERVPVNRVVTEAPASRQDGDTLIVPVMEEVLVVEKRLVLKEELHIRTATSERQAHEVVRLRSEQVHIEGSGTVAVPPSSTTKEG